MSEPDQILRRHFIAIATDKFEASGSFGPLDVEKEVSAMRRWLADDALAERRFDDAGFEALAARPTYDDIRDRLTNQQQFTDADAVVLYVTGHGLIDKGVHRVVLHKTAPDRPATTAVATAELIRWLAEHHGLTQVLLIVDLCQVGGVLDEMPATWRRDLPREWIALLTTPAGADAKVGAFTGVVESVIAELRKGSERDASDLQPYLESDVFIKRVKHRLWQAHRQDLVILQDPYEISCCLPNPRYDPARLDRVTTSAARRDLAILQQDLTAHWGPRAPVTSKMGEHGAVFSGRARLMSELIAFAGGPPGTLVVRGRAGSGKSAALARLVTCSDPAFWAEHSDLIAAAQPVPSEGAVDVAVLATGKTSEQIAVQIGRALGAENPTVTFSATLDAWIDSIGVSLTRRDGPPTVVIDALDEAADPLTVASTLLQRMNPQAQPRLRLLLGIRSAGAGLAPVGEGEAVGGQSATRALALRGRDLADGIAQSLGARQIWVDGDQMWDPEDLIVFVRQVLTQPQSPYRDDLAQVKLIAQAIEQSAGRSYLLAGLVARNLAESGQPLPADDPRLQSLLTQGISDLLGIDLIRSIADLTDRARALLLLRASALAFGRGIPWRGVWPTVATAISDGTQIGDSDVEWLLGGRMSGYLVRDVEDGATVYRPFHDELRSALASAADLYAAAGIVGGHLDLDEAHRRIARRLIPMVTGDGS